MRALLVLIALALIVPRADAGDFIPRKPKPEPAAPVAAAPAPAVKPKPRAKLVRKWRAAKPKPKKRPAEKRVAERRPMP